MRPRPGAGEQSPEGLATKAAASRMSGFGDWEVLKAKLRLDLLRGRSEVAAENRRKLTERTEALMPDPSERAVSWTELAATTRTEEDLEEEEEEGVERRTEAPALEARKEEIAESRRKL